MLGPTPLTWILTGFGIVFILLPVLYAQLLVALRPEGRKTKDLVIGKGEEYRDRTHSKMTYGLAWADLILWLPLLLAGSIGVVLGHTWGYCLWAASGAISAYVSILLWFGEREYTRPAAGGLAYYTYYWGFFLYWGVAAVAYTAIRMGGVRF